MNLTEMFVDENLTLVKAMEELDKVATKVLFIVDNYKLVASVTDGDIRRSILKDGNLQVKIKKIANYHPHFLHEADKNKAKKYMKEHSIEVLPIVDKSKNVLTVVIWNDGELRPQLEKINLPVVIMAGGFGTRLYPYTKIFPKPLIPIGDIPIIERIINRFYAQGCKSFHLIVNHKKNMIKAYFNEVKKKYHITYVDEDKPLGTGGGIGLLKGKVQETFILTNCDILVDSEFNKIYKFHKKNKNLITMVCSMNNFKIPYGVVNMGKDGCLESMQEKPSIPFLVNTGCYVVEPEVIENIAENKKLDFPDIVQQLKDLGRNVGVYPISEDSWFDMGQLDELEKMKKNSGIIDE
ncbi:MAG: NTP transferase domain-containing protein [Streptococcaceae bacterium]|jgi:dTDP-glucose pyrophosphorylase|nr:NTP transferase domain-containing protein [Streptococcaceae bacterium]